MERNTDLPVLLTTQQVADLLHQHVNTIRRWENRGIIRAYHIGPRGDRRFEQNEILSLISETINTNNKR